jgi:tetratricopeptide (TPR) repeat protein
MLTVDGYMEARGHTEPLLKLLDEAISQARDMGDDYRETLHSLLGKRGNAYRDHAKFGEAMTCYQEALRLARSLENAKREAILLAVIGRIHADLAKQTRDETQFEIGEAQLKHALEIAETLPDKDAMTLVLENHGYLANERGDHQTAHQMFERELEVSEDEPGEKEAAFHALLGLGSEEVISNDLDSAEDHLNRADQLAEEVHNAIWIAHVRRAKGELYHKQGGKDEAKRMFYEAKTLYLQTGNLSRFCEVISDMNANNYPVPQSEVDFCKSLGLL